jgi:EpsI family protein
MTLPSRWFNATVLILAATLTVSTLSEVRHPGRLARTLTNIPTELAGWTTVRDEQLATGVLAVLKPTSYLSRIYEKHGSQLTLFVAYYAEQRAGESMHSPKNCLPGGGWEIWRFDSALIPVGQSVAKVNEYSIQNGGARNLVFYWYQSNNRVIASEYLGKIMLVRDALFDGITAGSIVRIVLPDLPEARDEGRAFAAALIPEMQLCLGR